MRRLSALGCFFLVIQGLACGGSEAGNGSGDGDGDTSGDGDAAGGDGDGTVAACELQIDLDDALTLGQFSQEQADQLCDAYGDLILCTFPESMLCRNAGLAAARSEGTDSAETCHRVETECLLEGSKTQQEWEEPCEGASILSGCSVTVAELRQCYDELFARSAQLLSEREEPSCDDVAGYFEWAEETEEEPYPPSCDGLLACEDFQ